VAKNNTIKLFDLQLSTGVTISPFVWATKYALRHKGLDIEIVPGGFTGIRERTNGFHDRCPVIVDEGRWIKESWDIAEYLDEQYPGTPMLFSGDSMKALTRLTEGWLWATAVRPWFSCYILDYHNLSLPQDQPYVRHSRETLFLGGRKLEDVQAGREERLPLIPPQLEPLRQTLKKTPWLGGDQPNYADYRVLAVFLWLASVATIPALHADDPLKDYLDRGFDLYDGLGRHPGLHTLFGLPKADA
jgi:glutathione S-transferase